MVRWSMARISLLEMTMGTEIEDVLASIGELSGRGSGTLVLSWHPDKPINSSTTKAGLSMIKAPNFSDCAVQIFLESQALHVRAWSIVSK
jgi:hypothetical protein